MDRAAMESRVLPAATSALGAWVRKRLTDDPIAWLITVDSRGVAQPNPVWFLWEGDSILVYNRANARRLVHIRHRPSVTLHLDTLGLHGDSVVLVGVAEIESHEPPADQQPAFMQKYHDRMTTLSPAAWAEAFPVAVRITLTHFRGYHLAGPDRPGIT